MPPKKRKISKKKKQEQFQKLDAFVRISSVCGVCILLFMAMIAIVINSFFSFFPNNQELAVEKAQTEVDDITTQAERFIIDGDIEEVPEEQLDSVFDQLEE